MYLMTAYFIGAPPSQIPETAVKYFHLFNNGAGLQLQSTQDLVDLLFKDEGFISLASYGAEEDLPFMAFEILLKEYVPGVLKVNETGEVRKKDAALQLVFNEQNPNPAPDHAYNLSYPDSSISTLTDIVILHDEEKARVVFDAWRNGIPFVDDDLVHTYSLNPETGQYELQPFFDDDMA